VTHKLEINSERKLIDETLGKPLSFIESSIKIFGGETDTSETIYEYLNLEQSVWRSIERGTNRNTLHAHLYSYHSVFWLVRSWQDLHNDWQ